MKLKFEDAAKNNSRKIVMHESCFLGDRAILNKLSGNDILFCDDCLYSQYVFLKDNIAELQSKNIICVIGFSTGIFREDGSIPIYEAKCSECHDMFHRGILSARYAYMSICEIEELLSFSNVYLAAHGDQHLQLENADKTHLQKSLMFKLDIERMDSKLDKLGFKTNIFVFPYAYDDILLAYKMLKMRGYSTFFAGNGAKRIQIETIGNGDFLE